MRALRMWSSVAPKFVGGAMSSLPSITDFVIAIAAAFFGGLLFKRLRQPAVLGYLVGGIVVGPFATGLIHDTARISTLAQLGVAFLMFQAGTELSLSSLRRMQQVALFGPALQLLLTLPLVVVVVLLAQLPVAEVSYLGILLALSSTTVAIKLLSERGEIDTVPGRIAVAFSITQDLPMVPTIVIFTALAGLGASGSPGATAMGILVALGKAVAFVVVAYSIGTKVLPPLLRRVSGQGRELFLLCAVVVALGMAYLTNMLGISLALGAFIAGLVVAESEVSQRVLREVSPLSDLFVIFFFVSVGMLLDIPFLLTHLHSVAVVVLLVVVAKAAIITLVCLTFRYSGRTALFAGLALAQIGEEAFLLAQVGFSQGVLSSNSYSLVLAAAAISIILNPPLVAANGRILRLLEKVPLLKRAFEEGPKAFLVGPHGGPKDHVIICGYGQVGQELAQALERRGVAYVVVESEPWLVNRLRDQGVPCVLGDASREPALLKANIMRANTLAVTIPAPLVVEDVVRTARRLRQGIEIVVRGSGREKEIEELKALGASEVVHPSFEASLAFIRSVLRGNGVPPREVERLVLSKRVGFYG